MSLQSFASHFDRIPYNLTNMPQVTPDRLSTTWYKDATIIACQ